MYPDFVTIAKGYGIAALRVTEKAKLEDAFRALLADPDQAFVLDIVVEREENVFPMIPAGGSYRDILLCQADIEKSFGASQGSNI